MSTNNIPQWIWSREHGKYYHFTTDVYGNTVSRWADDYQTPQVVQQSSQQPNQQPIQQPNQQTYQQPVQNFLQYSEPQTGIQFYHQQSHQQQPGQRPRVDSGSGHNNAPNEPGRFIGSTDPTPLGSNDLTVPDDVRQNLRGLIEGTPGNVERLDATYYVRTGYDARRFFVVGRVFAMLYSEAAGNTSSNNGNDDAYSTIRWGEVVHSNIRRFVVVSVRQGFVYACGISTYSYRATLKQGCVPSEHAVVYFTGTDPGSCYVPGEWERGLYKEPIEVQPVDENLSMKRESRIRFSKTIPVEMNVKVKDIGRVHYDHMSKLVAYWEEEFNRAAS